MVIFFGILFQIAISVLAILYGYAAATNLGFSETEWYEKLFGILVISAGAYGLYDVSTMFNFIGG